MHLDEWFPDLEDRLSIQSTKAGDDTLRSIGRLSKFRILYADITHVTDAGLKHIEKLDQLNYINLQKTQVTDAGITALRQALPNCRIEWDGGVIEPR